MSNFNNWFLSWFEPPKTLGESSPKGLDFVEWGALLLFACFLPLREAPKTIFWALYTVTWLVNRIPQRNFGGKPTGCDYLVAAYLGAGLLSAAFAGIRTGHGKEWLANNDLFMQASLLICLWRGGYSCSQWRSLFAALLSSCILAEVEGLWLWKVTGANNALELKSVGHVNHSAIYLAIATGLAGSLYLAPETSKKRFYSLLVLGSGGLLLAGVLFSDSRAAVGAELVLLCALFVVACRRLPTFRASIPRVLVVVTVALLVFGGGAIQKQKDLAQANNTLSFRDQIWRRGTVAWRAHPIFGIGMGNFQQITDARLKEWLEARQQKFEEGKYATPYSHAHNLFINTLVERGAVGLAALLALLCAWAWSLLKNLPRIGDDSNTFLFWGGASTAWFIAVVPGLVNTTLHHEHGLFSAILLAGWLSWRSAPHRSNHGSFSTASDPALPAA